MIREDKQRVMITLPKRQLAGLRNCAARQKIPLSKLISQIISKKVEKLMISNDIYKTLTQDEMIRIAKAKWIDD